MVTVPWANVVLVIPLWGPSPKHQTENNLKRKTAYGVSARYLYGVLGNGVCRRLPDCIVKGIRELYPDSDHSYMGYQIS